MRCLEKVHAFLFVWFDSLHPINNLSDIKGWVYLGWTSAKLGLMCLAQDHNTETPVSREPAAPRSRVKYSSTEALHQQITEEDPNLKIMKYHSYIYQDINQSFMMQRCILIANFVCSLDIKAPLFMYQVDLSDHAIPKF